MKIVDVDHETKKSKFKRHILPIIKTGLGFGVTCYFLKTGVLHYENLINMDKVYEFLPSNIPVIKNFPILPQEIDFAVKLAEESIKTVVNTVGLNKMLIAAKALPFIQDITKPILESDKIKNSPVVHKIKEIFKAKEEANEKVNELEINEEFVLNKIKENANELGINEEIDLEELIKTVDLSEYKRREDFDNYLVNSEINYASEYLKTKVQDYKDKKEAVNKIEEIFKTKEKANELGINEEIDFEELIKDFDLSFYRVLEKTNDNSGNLGTNYAAFEYLRLAVAVCKDKKEADNKIKEIFKTKEKANELGINEEIDLEDLIKNIDPLVYKSYEDANNSSLNSETNYAFEYLKKRVQSYKDKKESEKEIVTEEVNNQSNINSEDENKPEKKKIPEQVKKLIIGAASLGLSVYLISTHQVDFNNLYNFDNLPHKFARIKEIAKGLNMNNIHLGVGVLNMANFILKKDTKTIETPPMMAAAPIIYRKILDAVVDFGKNTDSVVSKIEKKYINRNAKEQPLIPMHLRTPGTMQMWLCHEDEKTIITVNKLKETENEIQSPKRLHHIKDNTVIDKSNGPVLE